VAFGLKFSEKEEKEAKECVITENPEFTNNQENEECVAPQWVFEKDRMYLAKPEVISYLIKSMWPHCIQSSKSFANRFDISSLPYIITLYHTGSL
jgi:hypothetical protein